MTYKHHLSTGETCDIVTKEPLSLKELQKLVDGHIEMVWTGEPYITPTVLMVNEEGLLLDLPQNPTFPQLVGNVIEGKCVPGEDGYEFVGF